MKNTSLISQLAQVIGAIGIVALAAGMFFMASTLSSYLPELRTYLKYKAMNECAQDYRLEFTDTQNNTKVIRPVDDLYAKCLSDKNVQ